MQTGISASEAHGPTFRKLRSSKPKLPCGNSATQPSAQLLPCRTQSARKQPKVQNPEPFAKIRQVTSVRHAHGSTFHFELRSYDRSLPFGHQAIAAVLEICHSTKRPASSAPCILRGQPKRPASSALSASCEDSAAHMSQANQTGQTALPGVAKGFAEGHVSACCKLYDPHTQRQTLRKPRSSSARFIGPPTAWTLYRHWTLRKSCAKGALEATESQAVSIELGRGDRGVRSTSLACQKLHHIPEPKSIFCGLEFAKLRK